MEVIWGSRAESSYFKIRERIRNRFTEKEEASFVKLVFETISTIESFPNAYPITNNKNLKGTRRAVLHPHSTLFYRIEKNDQIRLLLFWDNRDDLEKLK